MARTPRSFTIGEGRREATPLLIGLFGPSGSGKTYSALELATGIQSVVGGEIVGIDTEARRMLHYADEFKFKHIDFKPPFGSLDYLDVLNQAVNEFKAKTIIVDSMSHEHEGPGGLITTHEAEVERMAGGQEWKRDRVKMLAWNLPKANRRALINGILRLNANFIFCFRAKSSAKPVKSSFTNQQGETKDKTEVVAMGYMPIAGEEFVFEMTLAALLQPGARGVATWNPELPGERTMVKLPKQFESLANRTEPLSQALGAKLARWSTGGASETVSEERRAPPPEQSEKRELPQREQPPAEGGGYEGI